MYYVDGTMQTAVAAAALVAAGFVACSQDQAFRYACRYLACIGCGCVDAWVFFVAAGIALSNLFPIQLAVQV